MSTRMSAGRVRSTYEFIKAHRDAVQRAGDVPRARRGAERLLRVAQAAALEPRAGGRPAASPDPRVVRRESRHLRRPARLPGPAGGRRDLQQAPRRAADARESLARAARLSHAALVGRQAVRPDPESPAAAIHGDAPEQGVGHGHHLHSDVAGLALPGRRHGSLLAQDRRLVRAARPFTASSCSTPC